jgi:hypothetical protein
MRMPAGAAAPGADRWAHSLTMGRWMRQHGPRRLGPAARWPGTGRHHRYLRRHVDQTMPSYSWGPCVPAWSVAPLAPGSGADSLQRMVGMPGRDWSLSMKRGAGARPRLTGRSADRAGRFGCRPAAGTLVSLADGSAPRSGRRFSHRGRSTSSIRPAPPGSPRASCSRTACAGPMCSGVQRMPMARDMVTLVSTPLYSNTTLVVFCPDAGGGGTLVLMPKFDVAAFLQLASTHRCHPHDAGAGAIPAPDGLPNSTASTCRRFGEVLHQRTVQAPR